MVNNQIIPFSPKNGNPGCMIGKEVEIHALSHLISVRFYITDYGNPSGTYSCRVFRFSEDDVPTLPVYDSEPVSKEVAFSGNQWVDIPLYPTDLILSPGKYLLAMKWVIPPGELGMDAQTIGFKESEDMGISWMNWNGGINEWYKDTGPHKGNFMIEPVLLGL